MRKGKSMEKQEAAVSCFKKGFNCSQAVFFVFGSDFGMDTDTAHRVACAFGGGLAGSGETCGAVTGALMALGLKYGMTDPGNQPAKEETYAYAKRFLQEFASRHHSTRCRDLLGRDITTPAERAQAKADGLFETVCPRFVRDAVQIVETLIGH